MAYKQTYGRGNAPKTGHGIPSPLRQDEDPVIDKNLQAKAKAMADNKLATNVANKPLGGSSDVRSEIGTATNIRPAKTPGEIAAWSKAMSAGKASGKYNETVSATSFAAGKDIPVAPSPKPTVQTAQTPKAPEAANA